MTKKDKLMKMKESKFKKMRGKKKKFDKFVKSHTDNMKKKPMMAGSGKMAY